MKCIKCEKETNDIKRWDKFAKHVLYLESSDAFKSMFFQEMIEKGKWTDIINGTTNKIDITLRVNIRY